MAQKGRTRRQTDIAGQTQSNNEAGPSIPRCDPPQPKRERKRKRKRKREVQPQSIFVAPLQPPVKAYPPIRAGRETSSAREGSRKGKEKAVGPEVPIAVVDQTDRPLNNSSASGSREVSNELNESSDDDTNTTHGRTKSTGQAARSSRPFTAAASRNGDGKEVDGGDLRKRALRAWETKRKRRRIADDTLSGVDTTPANSKSPSVAPSSSSQQPTTLATQSSVVPKDLPSNDLLQTIQAFASRFYTANGLILPSQDAGHTANDDRSRTSSPIRMAAPTGVISRNSPRSLSESNLLRQGSLRRAATQEQTNSEIVSGSSISGEAKRGGGQYGKRKKRDMYLALDGSALIALGVLVQEHIIEHIKQAGFVPSSTLDDDTDTDSDSDTQGRADPRRNVTTDSQRSILSDTTINRVHLPASVRQESVGREVSASASETSTASPSSDGELQLPSTSGSDIDDTSDGGDAFGGRTGPWNDGYGLDDNDEHQGEISEEDEFDAMSTWGIGK